MRGGSQGDADAKGNLASFLDVVQSHEDLFAGELRSVARQLEDISMTVQAMNLRSDALMDQAITETIASAQEQVRRELIANFEQEKRQLIDASDKEWQERLDAARSEWEERHATEIAQERKRIDDALDRTREILSRELAERLDGAFADLRPRLAMGTGTQSADSKAQAQAMAG